jgi:hypothetical protein
MFADWALVAMSGELEARNLTLCSLTIGKKHNEKCSCQGGELAFQGLADPGDTNTGCDCIKVNLFLLKSLCCGG